MATSRVTATPQAHHLSKKPPVVLEAPTQLPALNPAQLLQLGVTQDLDIDRLERLIQLKIDWDKNEARKAFVVGMNAFKVNPPAILKTASASITSDRGKYGYNYAPLDQVCSAIITALSAQGISHRWTMFQSQGLIRVTCILTHKDGHSEETALEGHADQTGGKNSIQAVGSTVTYLQRYTLLAAVGLAASGCDTDGHVAPVTPVAPVAAPGNSGLPAARVKELCQRIAKVTHIDQLRSTFTEAYREASGCNDKAAQDAFIAAKDQRRKEFRCQPQ